MAHWSFPRDPLLALREGDPGPFEDFAERHARTFYTYFRRRGLAPEEAEDLTQDVFVRLYDHAPGYRASERFRALAYRVARNLWVDHARRHRVRPIEDASEERLDREQARRRGEREEPVEGLILREEARRLRGALARLPETHREVFELAVEEELPYAEISRVLGIPTGTVKSRMFHAVRRLREAARPARDERGGAS